MSLIFIQEHCIEIETYVSQFCVCLNIINELIILLMWAVIILSTTTKLKKVFVWARGVFVFFFYKYHMILFKKKKSICVSNRCVQKRRMRFMAWKLREILEKHLLNLSQVHLVFGPLVEMTVFPEGIPVKSAPDLYERNGMENKQTNNTSGLWEKWMFSPFTAVLSLENDHK